MMRSTRPFVCWGVGAVLAIGWLAPVASAQQVNPIVQLAAKMRQPINYPGIEQGITLRNALDVLSKLTGVAFDINTRAFTEPVEAAASAGDRGNDGLSFVAAQGKGGLGNGAPGARTKPGGILGAGNKTVPGGQGAPPPAGVLDPAGNLNDVPVTLPKMTAVRLETVLRRLLRQVQTPADYVLRRDGVEITTVRAKIAEFYREIDHPAALDVGPGPPPMPDDRFRFLPLVQVELHKTPLEEACKTLADATDYNVILDPRVGDKAKPVSATLINLPLDTAVELLANMSDLKVVLRDRALYVTTKENSDAMRRELRERMPQPPGVMIGPGIGPMGPGAGAPPPAVQQKGP